MQKHVLQRTSKDTQNMRKYVQKCTKMGKLCICISYRFGAQKLDPLWLGPFPIIRKEPRGQTYVVDMNGEQRIHVENLKPFVSPPAGEFKVVRWRMENQSSDGMASEETRVGEESRKVVDEAGNEIWR